MIIINKVYINEVSPQVFGRYISFILIPYILVNLLYLENSINKNYLNFVLIVFFLILSTPKKTFGFFFTNEIYSKYDQWNKDFYETRQKHKNFFDKTKNIFVNKAYKAIVVFDDYETIYDRHPSLYHAAFQLDLYPNEATIITLGDVMNQEFNLNHYLEGKNVLIYYNLERNEKNYIQTKIKKIRNEIKRELNVTLKN